MDDLISRSEVIAQLEEFKLTLGDVILGLVVDRVIERVHHMPATRPPKPAVEFDQIRRGLRLLWPDGSMEVLP